MPHHRSDRHPLRLLGLTVLGALALLLVACEDDDDADDVGAPVNEIEVVVGTDGLDPPVHQVRVPDQYQLVVSNETDEVCIFDFADLVLDLEVPANGTAQFDFQVPPSTDAEPAPGGVEEAEMGCQDQPERSGRVEILQATGSDLGVD